MKKYTVKVWLVNQSLKDEPTVSMPVNANSRKEALEQTSKALAAPSATMHYNDDSSGTSWLLRGDSILLAIAKEL